MRPSSPPTRALACALALAASLQAGTLAAQPNGASDVSTRAAAVKEALVKATRTVQVGAHDLAVYALGLIGVAYRFGGETPDDGMDCSGLVRHVFQHVSGLVLPRTAKEMSRVGGSVALADLVPGDLVFFNTRRFAFSHVGIYVGDSRFIHAPRTGRDVEIANLDNSYWRQRFNGARRLVVAAAPRDLFPLAVGEPGETQDVQEIVVSDVR